MRYQGGGEHHRRVATEDLLPSPSPLGQARDSDRIDGSETSRARVPGLRATRWVLARNRSNVIDTNLAIDYGHNL